MKKLTPTQRKILLRLDEEWSLGWSSSLHGRTWIQKGGVGRGGETEIITVGTANVLVRRHLVARGRERIWSTEYTISDLGREEAARIRREEEPCSSKT